MKLQLRVQSKSPLALSANRANEQFASGLDYIPGTTLRGALAAIYLREFSEGEPDDTFSKLFLSNQIIYSDLLPTLPEAATSYIFPTTTQACKRYKLAHPHSLEDTLLNLAVYSGELENWEKRASSIPAMLLEPKSCVTCETLRQQSPLHSLSGYFVQTTSSNYSIKPVRPIHQRLIAGTSINRQTGTAQPGMLFSRDVLEEDQYFNGYIWLADDVAEDTLKALERLLPLEGILRVGYGRSRGLGKLRVVGCEEATSSSPSLAEHWQQFNDRAGELGLSSEKEYFSLTLISHWIRPSKFFDTSEALPNGADLGIPAARRRRCVVNHAQVLGWNAARKLPKESQPALGRGSALLFSVPKDKVAVAQAKLQDIETTGLGERRNEGFGQVSVCHPFHYQTIKVVG